jgi:hypothetical protein
MAISEFEIKKVERAAEQFLSKRRPAPQIRKELDLGYMIEGQSVEVLEIRPDWKDNTIIRKYPMAKATYVKTKKHWRVFWQRADLKWHNYEPAPTVKSIEEFFELVDEDTHACFFG